MSATVLVTGGTGTLGRLLVDQLRAVGHDVRLLSRRPPPVDEAGAIPTPAQWCVGNLATGEGLAAALEGVATVLHCATHFRGDLDMAHRLVATAKKSGKPHLVCVSIVGVDRIPYSYYRTKQSVEQVVERAGLPWTLQRATQFHELIFRGCAGLARLPVMPVPADTSFQPMAAADVAARLVELVNVGPAERAPDIAGPEVLSARTIAETYLRAAGMHRHVRELRLPGAAFAGYRSGAHLAPDHVVGGLTFAQHCAQTLGLDQPASAGGPRRAVGLSRHVQHAKRQR